MREFDLIKADVLQELKKFGRIVSFTFPRLEDLTQTSTIKESALGKAYVEFEEISSAFACYNMINERNFMGKPVEIEFFPKDSYITQSLFWKSNYYWFLLIK